jgi:hypothetical protein
MRRKLAREYTEPEFSGATIMVRLMELLLVIVTAALVLVTALYFIRTDWLNSDLIFPLIVAGFFFSLRPLLFR